jgi:hypothetical protein
MREFPVKVLSKFSRKNTMIIMTIPEQSFENIMTFCEFSA